MAKLQGKVVSVTPEGNLVTDIHADMLRAAPRNEAVKISCDEHETLGIFDANHQEPPMTFLALLNAAGQLELAIVGDSAKIMLGVRPGATVDVQW